MFPDFNSNTATHSVSNTRRDLGRKKRARFAKLKRSKLDVRREQWLSQGAVEDREFKEIPNNAGGPIKEHLRELILPSENLKIPQRGKNNEESISINSKVSESPSNSVTSLIGSFMSSNESGPNIAESSCNSSSRSIGGCYSWSISEEDVNDEDGECFDDWEAFADSIAATDKHENHCSESLPEPESVEEAVHLSKMLDELRLETVEADHSNRAWRHDDAFRPQCLPTVSKGYGNGPASLGINSNILATPTGASSCPICYEDLDATDLRFLPCLCGFRLCLFCHKRILEDDSRCPGCRKSYDTSPFITETSAHGGTFAFQSTSSRSNYRS